MLVKATLSFSFAMKLPPEPKTSLKKTAIEGLDAHHADLKLVETILQP